MYVLIAVFLLAAGTGLQAEKLPEWMLPLRDAVYEQQLKADEVEPLYRAAKTAAQSITPVRHWIWPFPVANILWGGSYKTRQTG